MSDATKAHGHGDAHAGHGAHGHGGADHVPHVSPLSLYMKTFGTLVVLTIITVGASRIDLGTSVNLAIALVIATIKASVVCAFFMHLWFDHKFHTVIFVSSVVFLGIFVSFTSFDMEFRGEMDRIEHARPDKVTDPFAAPTGMTPVPAPSAAPAK